MKINVELIIKVIIYIKSWSAENIVMLLEEKKYSVWHFRFNICGSNYYLIDRLTKYDKSKLNASSIFQTTVFCWSLK